jgi:hypothetical protein
MIDAAAQVAGVGLDEAQAARNGQKEIVEVVGPAVGQGLLGELPNAFVGVELGCVGRKAFEVEALGLTTELFDQASAMRICAIPKDDDVAFDLAQKLAKKVACFELADVVCVKGKVQIESFPNRAHRDARDRRDPIPAIEAEDGRRDPTRGPRSENRRSQLEARLIGKDEVGAQPTGVFLPWAIGV